MTKLTDVQLAVLNTAAERQHGLLLPLTKSLRLNKAVANRVLESLRNKGLAAEAPTKAGLDAWREDKEGRSMTLVITEAGRTALGVEGEQASRSTLKPLASRANKRTRTSRSKTIPSKARGDKTAGAKKTTGGTTSTARTMPSGAIVRAGTKQALLIELLRRKQGSTIDEIASATEWQAHSVRGAISGTLKKKLGLTIFSETVTGRGRVYRIAGRG